MTELGIGDTKNLIGQCPTNFLIKMSTVEYSIEVVKTLLKQSVNSCSVMVIVIGISGLTEVQSSTQATDHASLAIKTLCPVDDFSYIWQL